MQEEGSLNGSLTVYLGLESESQFILSLKYYEELTRLTGFIVKGKLSSNIQVNSAKM